MCTVSFHATRDGYRLGMNRDEQRSRVTGIAPTERVHDGRRLLGPAEPAGGTWINANDSGVTLALINWYSVPVPAGAAFHSRGSVIPAAATANTPGEVITALRQLPLEQTRPFRLIGIFPGVEEIHEWRWNLMALQGVVHPWRANVWISSGHDEAGAQKTRGNIFYRAIEAADAGSATWLRRLHGSHNPARGPYSFCMHRDDACTVSYTEVTLSGKTLSMVYANGSPCAIHWPDVAESSIRLNTSDGVAAHAPS